MIVESGVLQAWAVDADGSRMFQIRVPMLFDSVPEPPGTVVVEEQIYVLHKTNPLTYKYRGVPLLGTKVIE